MKQYQKLYTPADSAIAFIDFQPQMLFGVANADRATLINNVTLANGPGWCHATDDDRRASRMAARLEGPRALRRADDDLEAACRGIWQRRRVRVHDGAQGSAVCEQAASRAKGGLVMSTSHAT